MVLVMYYYLYKYWLALTAGDNYCTTLDTIISFTQSLHTYRDRNRTIIVLTAGESEVDDPLCNPPSSTEVSLIQMCLKFLFRWIDRLTGEPERDTRAVASHSGPSLDWISIVVQLYRQVFWLQEGEDTGHHTRQGSTFFAAWGGLYQQLCKSTELTGSALKLSKTT